MESAISAAVQQLSDPGKGPGPDHPILAAADTYRTAGKLDKAETSLRRFLKSHPDSAWAWHGLGLVARDRGRPDRAAQLLEKAVSAAPGAPAIQCDYGLALKAAGRLDEAITAQRRVADILPGSAPAWSNLGTALSAASRYEDALTAFDRALSIDPRNAEMHYNAGNAWLALGKPQDAEAAFVRALELSPGHAGAIGNLAGALKEQGRLADAEALLTEGAVLHPDNPDLRWNLALTLLMAGRYRDGWAAYEARRAIPGFAIAPQKLPAWDGSDLAGRRLLVHAEQGFGDTIQFCRYLAGLHDQDGEIVFQAPTRLLPLLRSLTGAKGRVDITDSARTAARCDVQAPLLSLPRLAGRAAPFWPGGNGYLSAEPDRMDRWKKQLAGHRGLSVAIAWQGDPAYRADRSRSIPLKAFAPLARIADIRLVSLQQGPGCAQIDGLPWADRILALGEDIDGDGAFLDSAAILASVDLMVTSDTALAHLAGALGVPVWLALSQVPDWRWGLTGAGCAWYPSFRLFRQNAPGDWNSVFNNIATAIKEMPA